MITAYDALRARWAADPELAPWAAVLPAQLAAGFSEARHGDLAGWSAALESMPAVEEVCFELNRPTVAVRARGELPGSVRPALRDALERLKPWRKGPFHLLGVDIDTEWRSDWKWQRIAPHIRALEGRRVLDVGCGSGYHCWRMRGAGAEEVVGVEPAPLYVLQFLALQRYIADPAVSVIPCALEALPPKLQAFDTVFSMGVLYHRRSPMGHLARLREALRPGGELVLETLVVEGDERTLLVPEGRYARMRNVWFLPSAAMLVGWLRKCRFREPRVISTSITSTEEQRPTPWMEFQSLAHSLAPGDPKRTIEGYPAPRRAVVVAQAPG